tara:strand:- start:3802 stop:4035 length:234 start_codon:yes stop_codon:yes gene_type:complete
MNEKNYLNLRSIPCPVNFIRCSLAAEDLKPREFLKVDLDTGEPEETVIKGLIEAGYDVKIIKKEKKFLTINIESREV